MKNSVKIITVLAILAMAGSALAVEVIDPAFQVETFATYSEAGLGRDRDMTFAGDGNLYVTHRESNTIWKITSDGTATKFVSGAGAQGITWAGGTDFGDNLFVSNGEIWTGKVCKVSLAGAVSSFAPFEPPRHCPSPIAVDITGNYGGHLYTATGCQDRTYRITTSAAVSLFADFPGWRDGGGPYDMAFDPTTNYAGRMYMSNSYNDCCGNQYISGLWSLTPAGSASRFTEDLAIAGSIAFDHVGDFGGLMFVTGNTTYDTGWSIWQIDPDGTATEFAVPVVDRPSLAFGPDGALYVAEYDEDTETTVISRIYAGPPPLLVALEITGPDEAAENHQTQYHAIAHYDNSSTKDVTDSAVWSVEPTSLADANAGLLTTQPISYYHEDITIYAQYTEDSNTVDAEKPVSILAICPTGTALQFDGTDDYIEIANENVFDISDTLTLLAWIRPNSFDSRIVSKWKSGNLAYVLYLMPGGNIEFAFSSDCSWDTGGNGPDAWRVESLQTVETGNWSHCAAIHDGTTIKVYVNGNEVIRTSVSPTICTAGSESVRIGIDGDGYGPFDGLIDEVAIYNRALTADEIRALMHTKLTGSEDGLVGYWNLDEGEGQVAHDLSANANNGYLGSDPCAPDSKDPVWVDSDAPVEFCTLGGFVERYLSEALESKLNSLEEIDSAMIMEKIALDALDRAFQENDHDDLRKRDVVVTKQKIHSAMRHQQQSVDSLEKGITKVEESLTTMDGD